MTPARQDAIGRDHIGQIVMITVKLSAAGCRHLRDAAHCFADLDRTNVRNEQDRARRDRQRVQRATKKRGAARARGGAQ